MCMPTWSDIADNPVPESEADKTRESDSGRWTETEVELDWDVDDLLNGHVDYE